MEFLLSLILVFSVCSTLPGAVTTAPVDSELWKRPCAGGTAVAPVFTIPRLTATDVNDRLKSLIIKTKDNVELACTLKQMLNSSIGSSFLVNYLQQYPSLNGFPSVSSSIITLKENMALDYERIANVYIFLEQSSDDSSHQPEFKILANKMLSLLCEFEVILAALQYEFTSEITRDNMPKSYRDLNLAKRLDRDYIIVRDLIIILQSFIPTYKFHLAHYI